MGFRGLGCKGSGFGDCLGFRVHIWFGVSGGGVWGFRVGFRVLGCRVSGLGLGRG